MAPTVLRLRRPLIVVGHLFLFAGAYALAVAVRFDFSVPPDELSRLLATLPILLAARSIAFGFFRLYEGLWRYVSVRDLVVLLKATTLSSAVFIAAALIFVGHGFPRSVFLIDWLLCLLLVGGLRMATRVVRESRVTPAASARRTLIVGAGDAGERLIREISGSPELGYRIVGLVDDHPRKRHFGIHGIRVLGTVAQLPHLCRAHNVDEVLIATPSASNEEHRRIVEQCREASVSFKTVPSMFDLVSGCARITSLRDVRSGDLLPRDAVSLDLDLLRAAHAGKRVLVTGAGGSIGSEVARQVSEFEPDALFLLDRAESGLYYIDREIRSRHPRMRVVPIICDICDEGRIAGVMETHSPHVIYHAAAYKHVGLMEDHPLEAIENNVRGTRVVAEAAQTIRAERFVLISTDKAVRPVGVMGMTKRLSECVVRTLSGGSTVFVAVRFGNVLGSEGSVVPLFNRQIESGAPVTITDPDATRYFMLISEAAQLVLQAGAIGRGGEVFLLDMGEPMKVFDLAESLLRRAGLEAGRDVAIEITGLRAGERLSEELIGDGELLEPSTGQKTMVVRNGDFQRGSFLAELETLDELVHNRDRDAALAKLRGMATRY